MRGWVSVVVLLLLFAGCDETPGTTTVVIEDETPDIIHVYHTTVQEDTTPDVIVTYETEYVTLEDNTPDVVREYYSDAADLPMLEWQDAGGSPTMPKKTTDLTVATIGNPADTIAIVQSGTSKQVVLGKVHVAYPPQHIHGLICYNDSGDYDHRIEVFPGGCRDNSDADNMDLVTPIAKDITAAWAVGNDNGGLDTGSVAANTMYAIWLIKRSDTGVVDVLFSTSFTAPTMPTNYDLKRLIGAMSTDGSSNWYRFNQNGDYFHYNSTGTGAYPPRDVNDNTLTSTVWETGTFSAPPHAIVSVFALCANSTGTQAGNALYIRKPGTATWGGAPYHQDISYDNPGTQYWNSMGVPGTYQLDGSRQLEYMTVFTAGSAIIEIYTLGFWMPQRRDF
jgi:hypothetical protein